MKAATFETQATPVPDKPPLALSPEFYDDREKSAQWKAFLNKAQLNAELAEIAEALRAFLMPVSEAVARDETSNRIGNTVDLGVLAE